MKFTQLAVLSSIIAAGVSSAYADIKVGVVTSSSGPVAMVGIPQKNTIALLPKTLGGEKVQYISIDDASDPTASFRIFYSYAEQYYVHT